MSLKNNTNPIGIDLNVLNRCIWTLRDTGAELSAISGRMYRKTVAKAGCQLTKLKDKGIIAASGAKPKCLEKTVLPITMKNEAWQVPVCVVDNLLFDVILGNDFLDGCVLNLKEKKLSFGD